MSATTTFPSVNRAATAAVPVFRFVSSVLVTGLCVPPDSGSAGNSG